MSEIDGVTLAAFMDGELDLAEARRVEQALAVDTALRKRLERLRAVDGAVRAAFEQVAHLPAPALREPVVPTSFASGGRGRWLLPLSMAASLLALAGTGVLAYQLGQMQQARLVEAEQARTVALQNAFQRVIDSELSGTTVSWRSGDGNLRAEFTPVRTWRTDSGRYCREFTEVRVENGVAREEGGVACRRDDGRWRVRVRYYPE